MTLQCVPAFNLRVVEQPTRVDDLLANLDEHVDGNDHFEFFWVPHTGWALTKWNHRTDEPSATQPLAGVLRRHADEQRRVRRALPSRPPASVAHPTALALIPSSGRVEYVDRSYRVFASPRLVQFYEMEYSIPREACAEALNRVRKFVDQSGLNISFPVEVRFTAPDDIPLSTAYGRPSCYIAVHVYQGMQYQPVLRGGRGHHGRLRRPTPLGRASHYLDTTFRAAF